MSSHDITPNQGVGGRDKLETIGRLHRQGVHFVRCKPNKVAIAKGWQKRPESLTAVVRHDESGGLLGYIPGRSGIWGADVDHFPGDERSAHALLQKLNIEPLSVIHTQRGLHLLFRRDENEPEIPNQNWEQSGFSGELRGDHGYLILWQPEKVLHALAAWALAKPVSTTLFPPPSKNGATPTAKGFVKGNRTDHLNALVFAGAGRGETDFSAQRAAAIESGLPVEKVDTIIKKAVADAAANRKTTGEVSEDSVALAFTERYRASMRYCPELGSWFEWDETRWRPDRLARAFHYARGLARAGSDTKTARKAGFARGVEWFCRADPAHAVEANYWDTNPWHLGTPGGTVDLKSGRVLAADPAHRITKLTTIAPGQAGECPRWLQFLSESTGGDNQLIAFLQRWFGYCLTGSVREQALTFFYGPGNNGKSVFLGVLAGVLGDYSTTASMDILTSAKFDRHPTEIAALAGARLVTATETEEGRVWAEARGKAANGRRPPQRSVHASRPV